LRPTVTRLAPFLLMLAGCGGGDAAGDAGGGRAKGPQGTPEAGFVVLASERVPLETVLPGRTAAFETSDVRPQITGLIEARLFTEGAIVRRGQTLYRIDQSLYRAAVAEAEAALANAVATRTAAQARADRFRPLAEIEAVSKQEYTDAVAAARQADAAVQQARARIDTARINLRFTNVPAPISGRIGRSLATTGALVTANQAEPLTMIQRLDPIFVDIPQSSADLLALRRSLANGGSVPASAEVRLTLEDGGDYPQVGTLQFAEAMVDPQTGAVTLRASFPNPQGMLLPGMYVRARFAQAVAREGLLVPQAAVSRDPRGNATVMLVGPENKAVRRNIRAERTIGDKWLVTAGVRAGDRVVVEGLSRIRDGQEIRPVPAGSPPPPPSQAAPKGDAAPKSDG
jgi:membrane fusion protein, multidrug efflux system